MAPISRKLRRDTGPAHGLAGISPPPNALLVDLPMKHLPISGFCVPRLARTPRSIIADRHSAAAKILILSLVRGAS